jgi:pilus assembly protein TadC
VTLLAALLSGSAVLVLLGRGDGGRLGRAVPRAAPIVTGRAAVRIPTPVVACGVAGVALALALPLPAGPAAGAAVALAGPRLLARLEPRSVREQRARLTADLPLVLDLLASCLAGGAALPQAAAAVAAAVPGPAGQRLAAVSASLAVGSPAPEAWAALAAGSAEDPLAPAARALARAADGGAPVAAAVSRLAAEARAEAASSGEQAARRVGVLVVAPLGLCFLPAFVLLGVVPVVIGLAGPLLASF